MWHGDYHASSWHDFPTRIYQIDSEVIGGWQKTAWVPMYG